MMQAPDARKYAISSKRALQREITMQSHCNHGRWVIAVIAMAAARESDETSALDVTLE
jgi:hypothetical protein